ncbi:MAG TPA: Crp/Fnr family transcriptional regulator [Sporichthyaceae bacterium]|nr:Crp/Fnr family transcriptional regulator [Sporichthyaceae bacterium]
MGLASQDRAGSIAGLLAGAGLFADVPRELLDRIAAVASERTFRKGQFVFQQGDPGDSCYVIVTGSVKVLTTTVDGAEVIHCTLGPGDCFGELSFLDGLDRSAAVETLEDSRLLVLRAPALDVLLGNPPATRALLAYQGSLIRRLTEQAADLMVLDLPARLAKCLDRLAAAHGVVSPEGIRLELALTQSELAALVGASRPTVNAALAEFTRRGWIRSSGRTLLITDADALRRRHDPHHKPGTGGRSG